MSASNLSPVIAALQQHMPGLTIHTAQPAAGGCIHQNAVLTGDYDKRPERWFLKYNHISQLPALQAEQDGLRILHHAMSATTCLRIPEPLICGTTNTQAFLLMTFLPLTKQHSAQAEVRLGHGLFQLHETLSADGCFGHNRDNFIGTSPQANTPAGNWADFFRNQRLTPQLAMARNRGFHDIFAQGQRLVRQLPEYLDNHEPQPSLLHGDLWAGNAGFLANGTPAIFDPAVYYGDRETDLAMMRLFGGFSPAVFTAYRKAATAAGKPLPAENDPVFRRRQQIYQLYHLLNHLNLFGSGYLPSVARCLHAISSL